MPGDRHVRHPALVWSRPKPEQSLVRKLFDWKPFLVLVCLLPAAGLLLTFLTYPLGLGIWLGFTDHDRPARRLGRAREFRVPVRGPDLLERGLLQRLLHGVATIGKFALGLWLALLLNNHLPFKSLLRAIILLPWIVPTVLSAIAFWWIYNPQFSIISCADRAGAARDECGLHQHAWPARWSLIAANIWRGIPFVAISLLAGLQTISPSLYEAALLDGSTPGSASATSPSRCCCRSWRS
jgi:multiple sugar transport system permease protein